MFVLFLEWLILYMKCMRECNAAEEKEHWVKSFASEIRKLIQDAFKYICKFKVSFNWLASALFVTIWMNLSLEIKVKIWNYIDTMQALLKDKCSKKSLTKIIWQCLLYYLYFGLLSWKSVMILLWNERRHPVLVYHWQTECWLFLLWL